MQSKYRILFSVIAIIFFSVAVLAQTTAYETPKFSASFNGPVTTKDVGRNDANTSSTISYNSFDEATGIEEMIFVRTLDGPTDVTPEAAESYVDQDATHGTVLSRSKDYYQGRPYSYLCMDMDMSGTTARERERVIIANAHEVIWVVMLSTPDGSNKDEWARFDTSLVIK